jgi:quercetin dioxygenase-like cupin family protein
MKILKLEDIDAKEVSKDPLFFGGKVTTQFVLEEEHKGQKLQIMLVRFAAGARNKLHTHSTEQILVVTEGRGIIATKDQEHIVTPGMIAFISPGEQHWHGATSDSPFAHLSIIGQPNEMKIMEN